MQRFVFQRTSIINWSQNWPRCFHTTRCVRETSLEKEYLHNTKIPTYHFQKSLPRLPVPALEKTCQRYLKAQIPLLTPDEHKELESLVADFETNHGQQLHKDLVANDKKNKHTNYVNDVWFDMYLKDRRPVVFTHNPFITFVNDPKPEYNTQLIRSANMLISCVRTMKTLRDEQLTPEIFHLNPAKSDTDTFANVTRLLPPSLSWYGAYLFKAFPLDMSQYKNLFCSTRIPRPERDELYVKKDSKHVMVMCNGNIYVFDVLDADGNIIPETEILAHLSYIQNDPAPPPEFPISTLTSENRDVWCDARVKLLNSDPSHEQKLNLIDSAIFTMCLDNTENLDPDDMTREFLYGDGVNRWYDKSFQLFFTKDGVASIMFEHAWGDGVAVLRLIRESFEDSTKKPKVHPDTVPSSNANSGATVQRLDFNLDNSLQDTVRQAKERFDSAANSLTVGHLQYTKLTKNDAKKAKLSPDSLIQLVIQMANFRMYGGNTGTYESCSTSAFQFGRTETVRPCTTATDAVCKALYGKDSCDASVEELQQMLQECTKVHNQLTKEAAMGNGFDRHLFCLKNLSEQQGMSLPMFTNPAYKTINHIVLSTSTLSDPAVVIGGFAAVTPDGYGIGYGARHDSFGFNVTGYPAVNVPDFLYNCEKSLDDLYNILSGKKPECKK